MRLKKLEIHGFKSFADKTEIIFNQGITGIVGPNGSGKSNIGDAVRWVLGEQSARVLRGAKMEDVIFGGTAKRKAANYCEVTLSFDNEDGKLRSSFSEVCVTRRVYRNGDSEYYLNQNACRLKDILELFRDTGIGREGYSLIGQGRIDEILSVKSEDRRQIFEEAAGVMTFRFRKEEAERKLNRTEENLSRVNDILTELEDRIGPLTSQAETARKYLEYAEQLKSLEINIFLIRHDKLEEKIGVIRQTVDGLKDVLLQHEAFLNENNAKREAIEQTITDLELRLNNAREEHLAENDEYHRLKSEYDLLSQQLEANQDAVQALKNEMENNQRRRKEILALTDKGRQDAQSSADSLEKARNEAEKCEAELDKAISEGERCEQELDEHKTAILNAVNRLSDVRNDQARKQTMMSQMQTRLSEITVSRNELEKKTEALKANLQKAQAQSDRVVRNLEEYRNKAAEAEGRLRAFNEDSRKKSNDIQQYNLKLQSDKSRLRLMEDMSREMDGYNQSVKQALLFARNDPDVFGVVARLIRVPRELETAIDMVLGAALQNIVTRNEDAAKRVIDHLRTNRLGRATFLPVSSIRSRVLTPEERKLLRMPGCIGVASELIGYDANYTEIFENLLGRTVIAKDLESGIAIMRAGHHAFRLVTLDGDVMHSGGSMTGGTTQSKATSLLGRERETKELRQKVQQETDTLRSMQESLEKQLSEGEILRSERDIALDNVHQEEIAVAREQERVFNARAELNAHEERTEQARMAIEQLNESLKELEEDLKQAEHETANVSVDRDELDRKTSVLQMKLKNARERIDDLREKTRKAQISYSELNHILDTLNRDQERQNRELSAMEERIEQISVQLAEKEENAARIAQEQERVTLEKEKVLSSVEEKKGIVDRLETERAEKTSQQRECIARSEEMHRRYDEDSLQLHKQELSCSKAENDLKVMCDHIFNTYELTYAAAEPFRIAEGFNLGESERTAASLRTSIRNLGPINIHAIDEYAEVRDRFDSLSTQREDLNKAREDLTNLITRLLSQMENQFVNEFDKLKVFFTETFARLFGGGQAELRLTDPNDALNCGIEIIAQPPGKKLQLLSLLSGGERALTAIAILFAMLKLKPTPFCILDEIEAALDEANIGYFADYLAEFAKDTQFVVVSHRKGTMERCDSLFGVAMQEKGVSRIVSVDLRDYE